MTEFDRWAGSLNKEAVRVIGSNLSTLLGTSGVVTHPWKSGVSPDASVEIYIERFEKGSDGKAVLVASWQVYGADGRTPLLFHRSELSKESGSSYGDITQALSELTGELSREIATVIAGIDPAPKR